MVSAPQRAGGGPEYVTTYYPAHIEKCTACGWDNMAPDDCPVNMSEKECKWVEKQKGVGPKGEDVWSTYTGTRAELLDLYMTV